ncbi:H-NS histone family protein [Methyloversatilis sp. MC4-4]|uniref:H-NS histone family protein n=1 Tax=Methyloversatilis sp. MC4-4 TaxID=3132824 RepID=UPI003CED6EC0
MGARTHDPARRLCARLLPGLDPRQAAYRFTVFHRYRARTDAGRIFPRKMILHPDRITSGNSIKSIYGMNFRAYHSISSTHGDNAMSGQSYDELMAKIAELQQQAEAVRRAELEEVISDVRAKIKKYNLSASDVGLAGGAARRSGRPAAAAKVKIAPGKYRNPATGEIKEIGAAGRKPGWLAAMSADELAAARVS